MTRQDTPAAKLRAPLSDRAPAPTRAGRAKSVARRPDLRRLLQRTLAALERDLPALRAAELCQAEVAAFLASQLAPLSGSSAAPPIQAAADPREPRAGGPSSGYGAAHTAMLNALRQLERESPAGALLSVRELRALSGLDKPSFDSAALELAGQGRVSLHAHDHAGALQEAERHALIEDARGVHYVGIASIPDALHEVSL